MSADSQVFHAQVKYTNMSFTLTHDKLSYSMSYAIYIMQCKDEHRFLSVKYKQYNDFSMFTTLRL